MTSKEGDKGWSCHEVNDPLPKTTPRIELYSIANKKQKHSRVCGTHLKHYLAPVSEQSVSTPSVCKPEKSSVPMLSTSVEQDVNDVSTSISPAKSSTPVLFQSPLLTPVREAQKVLAATPQQMSSPSEPLQMSSPSEPQQMSSPSEPQQMSSPSEPQQMLSPSEPQQMSTPVRPRKTTVASHVPRKKTPISTRTICLTAVEHSAIKNGEWLDDMAIHAAQILLTKLDNGAVGGLVNPLLLNTWWEPPALPFVQIFNQNVEPLGCSINNRMQCRLCTPV